MPGNYRQWIRPAASVECIRLPWNVSVTLITRRLSRRSLFVGDADSMATDNAR